jgi:uncharacterized protein YuzE
MGNSESKEENIEDQWMDKNKRRSRTNTEHSISDPQNFKSHIKVKFDEKGKIIGMPELWVDLLKISPEMVEYSVDTEEYDD